MLLLGADNLLMLILFEYQAHIICFSGISQSGTYYSYYWHYYIYFWHVLIILFISFDLEVIGGEIFPESNKTTTLYKWKETLFSAGYLIFCQIDSINTLRNVPR